MFVNVAPIVSNCWPTNRLNLYAYSAKSKYKYFSNQSIQMESTADNAKIIENQNKICEKKKRKLNVIDFMCWKVEVEEK